MDLKNIFITAIGSMSAEACISSLNDNKIYPFVGDIYPECWHLHVTVKNSQKFFQLPLAYQEEYIGTILSICKKNDISHIFPLTDVEIDTLNQHREMFENENIVLCMSPRNTILAVRNKKTVYDLLQNNNVISAIPTVSWSDRKALSGTVIAKPATGRSSEKMFVLKNCETLHLLTDNPDNYILQPYLKGEVITCDFVRDCSGNAEFSMRKELIRTVNGAGTAIEFFYDEKLSEILNFLGNFFNITGCVNFEFLRTKNEIYLMDVNPRFSAGVSFSIRAGFDMVTNHLRCFCGKDIVKASQPLRTGIFTKRFETLPIITDNA